MNWDRIRTHYAQLLADAQRADPRVTQDSVATAGGLAQNAISKLLANHNLGPSAETLVKAILGLGMTVSEFFAGIEEQERQLPVAAKPILERLQDLELALAALRSSPPSSPHPTSADASPVDHRRSSHGVASLSPGSTGVVNNIHTHAPDLYEFRQEVAQAFESLHDELKRVASSVAEHRGADGAVDSRAPALRIADRGEPAKTA
jgi:transcriptional regulator with XRE-family HTH domain